MFQVIPGLYPGMTWNSGISDFSLEKYDCRRFGGAKTLAGVHSEKILADKGL